MQQKIIKTFCLIFLPFYIAVVGTSTLAADNSLEQRVQVLEDKEAIRTLLLSYGRYVDARDWDAFAALFVSEGGTWNGGMGIATGPVEIKNMMVSTIGVANNTGANGNGMSNLHVLSNEFIDVHGDTASALSKWIFVMTAENGGPDAVFVGHYVDQLVRINGTWLFRERVVHGDIMRATTINELNNNSAQ